MQDRYGDERAPLSEMVPVMVREGRRRVLPMAAVFCLIAVAALLVGMSWPRKYFATTSILVAEDNIIQQLMEGRAVPTGINDRALIAKEVIFSRKVTDDLLEHGGWLADEPSAAERDALAEAMRSRTVIGSPRENLIQIQYWDTDPQRAYEIAQRMAEMFIAESRAAKVEESREAYDFIAGRVDEYHTKLTAAEQSLKTFREKNPDARPGTETDVNVRIAALRGQVESSRLQLMELESQERSLAGQLGGASATRTVRSRQSGYHQRVAQLQEELDRLRMNYTDAHPDVVRVRHQIDGLRTEMASAGGRKDDDGPLVTGNPFHEELQVQLSDTRSAIAGLRSRLAATEALLEDALERGHRVTDSESYLAELNRGYEVNNEIYQDLLKRRENARLSMMLDEEGRGLTFRVHEPATVPARPSGLRLMHFAIGGLAAAAAMPFGLLFLLIRIDPRVRSASELERQTGLPVMATVPTYWNEADRQRWARRAMLAAGLVGITLLGYLAVGWAALANAT